jgi:hypothetical protein
MSLDCDDVVNDILCVFYEILENTPDLIFFIKENDIIAHITLPIM